MDSRARTFETAEKSVEALNEAIRTVDWDLGLIARAMEGDWGGKPENHPYEEDYRRAIKRMQASQRDLARIVTAWKAEV